jgi:small-conductance mechanosensitive channel
MEILSQTVFGNSLSAWLVAGGVFLLSLSGLLIARKLFEMRRLRQAQGKRNEVNTLVQELAEHTRLVFMLVFALYFASFSVMLPEGVVSFIHLVMIISVLLQTALWGLCLIDFLVLHRLENDRGERTTLNILGLIAKIALWSVIIMLILENITGIQVNTLVASLGITGIAVALAVQNILGDIFASLSIALDKPFIIGDTIQVGEFTGSVEQIGLSSTRLRAASGEQLIFSNSDLLNSRLRNLARQQQRQVVFSFNVSYATPPEKLTRIPALLEEIIRQQAQQITFDRAHLREMGSFALRYECAFTLETANFQTYLDAQQAIYLALLQRLEQEGVQIAVIPPNPPNVE